MELKHRIRALWCHSNAAERKLWNALQNPQNNQLRPAVGQTYPLFNYHFVRHVPLGDFFVDFLCADLKLVIELDGGLTDAEKQRELQRTTVLQYKGFLVVRLFQREILSNFNAVLDGLNLVLSQRKHALCKTRRQ